MVVQCVVDVDRGTFAGRGGERKGREGKEVVFKVQTRTNNKQSQTEKRKTKSAQQADTDITPSPHVRNVQYDITYMPGWI